MVLLSAVGQNNQSQRGKARDSSPEKFLFQLLPGSPREEGLHEREISSALAKGLEEGGGGEGGGVRL
jgi:hypothetical protein